MKQTNISFRSLYDGNITKGVEYTDTANLAIIISAILAEHKADDCFIMFPFNCSFTSLLTIDYSNCIS